MSQIDLTDNIEIANIPVMPEIARQFLQLHQQDMISEDQLASLLQAYPDFFRQLLSIINSDHFNLTTKVSSIQQAIELAGFQRVSNLLLCLVIYRTFNNIRIRGVEPDEFWQDSLRRAVSARMIGEVIGLQGSVCFSAGMLQDIGFFLLFLMSPNKGMLWAEFHKRDPEARYSMERNIFNMNHDQAMEYFCRQWLLPDDLSVAICAHHRCNKLELVEHDQQLCKVLYCADWMAAVYTSLDKGFAINRCRELLTRCFDMEAFRTEEFLAALPDEVDRTAMALNIPLKRHVKFSEILYEANLKLSQDNLNFQELTFRLEQALDERDRLAEELNRELGLAREIQRSLLPVEMSDDFPVCGINISARDLSGDFYDYFMLKDGRIYFELGDVSGKGVNAALLMAKTSSLFRCLGKRIDSPGELLALINTELCETSIHGMFVTMIAGIYCPDKDRLKLVNAGNPPALLFSPEGLAYEVEANAPPLGVLEEAEFPEIEIDLGENSLYMFSDGVTEGFVNEGEMLGMNGLFKAIATMDRSLKPRERIQHIVKRFKTYSDNIRDDVTLLLLEKQKSRQ
ncbi:MAG: HDOD domain-containing protein [Gammaproteobacteria bacterium]|nr:MAG: HDOD domain-containing protein [Gammaproteobacteria bacterium]